MTSSHGDGQGRTPLLVIVGPTASGKSDVALHLARTLNGEIISADSMQVYRGMDIGTAKPSRAEREAIPHHLLDLAGPDESYDVSRFQVEAAAAIDEVYRRGRLPILVGGSGLYIRAAIDRFNLPPKDESGAIRARLWERYEQEGEGPLRAELEGSDPEATGSIPPGNVRRIIRALEVSEMGAGPFSAFASEWKSFDSPYLLEIVGIHRERQDLYARINRRVEAMLGAGLLAEVQSLIDSGYHNALKSHQGLGYKELTDFIDGQQTLTESVGKIKQSTRRFAKRQMTWFNRDPRIHWVDVTGLDGDDVNRSVALHTDECERMAQVLKEFS